MILRRRDDLAMVMRELGGELFAVEGEVDRYFTRCPSRNTSWGKTLLCSKPRGHNFAHENGDYSWNDDLWRAYSIPCDELPQPVRVNIDRSPAPVVAMFRLWLLRESVERHIREGPQREAAALRKANWRSSCLKK